MDEVSLFGAALELTDPKERAAFLADNCAGDADVRRRLEQLLARHDRAGSFLENDSYAPTLAVANPEGTSDAPREMVGEVIGPYKLIERIGEGGMGVVFLADQQKPVRRKVALKIIKPGMDTRQVIARFEAERQALALMDHPHITRVLDGGATLSGRPYFVMDLVRGVPITDYCDSAKATIRERLALFVQVCSAVQHAHQKGIIHRDLKPSNVLVTLHDGKPIPKVIDFGVAKATGQALTEHSLHTGFTQMIGTPNYMSPEQAEMSGLDVDTRSDVYSLGVLLYELLTGALPFDRDTLKKGGLDEFRRIVREVEPPRPSGRIATLDGAALSTASTRRTIDPRKLASTVRGELDWIVMKSLEKDRNRRYESPSSLGADVERYLNGEAVQACPPSSAYRFRKFAQRNKGRLAMSGIVAAALIVAVSGIGWAVRDRAAERAQLAARTTTQIELILADVDRLMTEQKWPEALLVAERAQAALDGGGTDDEIQEKVAFVLEELNFVAELEAAQLIGMTFVNGKEDLAGNVQAYKDAFKGFGVDIETMSSEAAAEVLKPHSKISRPVVMALERWAKWSRTNDRDDSRWPTLIGIVRRVDRDPVRDEVRAIWERPTSSERLTELKRLSESIEVENQPAHTLGVLAESLADANLRDLEIECLTAAQREHPGDYWLNLRLGIAMHKRWRDDEAVRFFSTALGIRPDSPLAFTFLGSSLARRNKLDEAIACHRKAIDIEENLAIAHCYLGKALTLDGKLDEASDHLRTALEIEPKLAVAYSYLGSARLEKGDLEEAIACYRKAIELAPDFGPFHSDLGTTLQRQNKLDEAIACHRKAIALDPDYAAAHSNLGTALSKQRKFDEALACHQKALAIDSRLAFAHNNVGSVLAQTGKLDEAINCFRKAIEIDPKAILAYNNLGEALMEQGRIGDAIASYRQAIQVDTRQATSHFNLGIAFKKLGDHRNAVESYRNAVSQNSNDARFHNNLAWLLCTTPDLEVRKPSEAIECARRAVTIAPQKWGYWDTLSVACYRAGDWIGALEARDEAIRQCGDGDQTSNRLWLAMVYWQLNRHDEAFQEYAKVCGECEKRSEQDPELLGFLQEAEELLYVPPAPTSEASPMETVEAPSPQG